MLFFSVYDTTPAPSPRLGRKAGVERVCVGSSLTVGLWVRHHGVRPRVRAVAVVRHVAAGDGVARGGEVAGVATFSVVLRTDTATTAAISGDGQQLALVLQLDDAHRRTFVLSFLIFLYA